jgi:uncharacterized membrane protein
MKKEWEHSVVVHAPVEQVFSLVADVNRHPEWDKYTKRVELSKAGQPDGVGAEWKVYEQLGLFSLGETNNKDSKHLTGLAKRVIREVVPNKRVAWLTNSVPNVGISADMSYDFEAEGDSTRVTFRAVISVPGVLERVGRVILRNLDERQQGQWASSLGILKEQAEQAYARNGKVAVAV